MCFVSFESLFLSFYQMLKIAGDTHDTPQDSFEDVRDVYVMRRSSLYITIHKKSEYI